MFRCATHDQSLITALQYIQRYQHTTRALLPAEIALDFASVRWQALIKTRHKMTLMLHRRHLEVCVFHYLDHGLRSGDVYVEGSEAYADYRQQLLPWSACAAPPGLLSGRPTPRHRHGLRHAAPDASP